MGWEELHGVIESVETLVTIDSVALAFLCAVDGVVIVERTIIPSWWSIELLDGLRQLVGSIALQKVRELVRFRHQPIHSAFVLDGLDLLAKTLHLRAKIHVFFLPRLLLFGQEPCHSLTHPFAFRLMGSFKSFNWYRIANTILGCTRALRAP